jgi:hypothetical protein
MAGLPELEALELLRRSLAVRSDLHRHSLTVECRDIQESTAWMREAYSLARAASPLLLVLVPVGTHLLDRRRIVPKSTFGKLLVGWQAGKRLTSLWRAFSSSGHPS